MAHHLTRSLCFAALVATLVLPACKSSSVSSERGHSTRAASRAVAAEPLTSREAPGSRKTYEGLPVAGVRRLGQYQMEDSPPSLAELSRSPDPNVRIQALDAWARDPGESLDPLTYALVDPDDSVRARAQEILEQELARR